MKNFEREFLRRAAGIQPSIDKKINEGYVEGISSTKTLDVESEMLRIFSSTVRDLRRLKDIIENRNGSIDYYQGPGMRTPSRLKGDKGEIDKEKLLEIAMGKLDIIEDTILDCFDSKIHKEVEKEIDKEYGYDDEDDYEDDYEDEESFDDEEDEFNFN